MTDNGASDGLAILFQNGKTYLGRAVPSKGGVGAEPLGTLSLDPAYELSAVVQQTAPGNLSIGHACVPILMLPSLRRLPVSGTLVPLSDLSPADQKSMRGAYESGAKLANDLRAAQSGVVRAPAAALSQLPKRPG